MLARAALALCVVLSGCASTTVDRTGTGARESLCQAAGERWSALVLWGPRWRSDQKDVALREDAARQGLEAFFAESDCFARVEIRRLANELSADAPSDREVLALAAALQPAPERALVVRVRELGPVLRLGGSTALVEGGTEVVLDLRVFDVRTGESMANFQTRWQDGGAYVVKGVTTLPQDMRAALQAALVPAPRSR